MDFKEWLELNEEKDACYHKVKSRYKVWPSAYACVPIGTSKALTKEGWKSYNQLVVGEEILTFNLEHNELEFQPIINLYNYDDAETCVIEDQNTGLKFECTANHKWVVKFSDCNEEKEICTDVVNSMKLLTIEEILNGPLSERQIVVNAKYAGDQPIDVFDCNYVACDETKSLENFKLIEARKSDVWCPQTANATWVMMQETDSSEIITITGNSGALVKCRKVGADNWGNKTKKNESSENELDESIFSLEKSRGLRGWFDRNRGKGWIDCKASRKGKLVPCGRKKTGKGAERAYPACRPNLSACNKIGKKRKKSSKRISWEK